MQSGKATDAEKTIQQLEGLSINDPSESSASPIPTPSSAAALNIQNALQYIDAVKKRFADEPEVYDEFLSLMKDFHHQCIDTADVTEKIKQIFEGHLDLIKDFDRFLPPGYSDADESGEKRDNDDDSEDSGTASPGGGSRAGTPTPEAVQKASAAPKVSGEETIAYIQRVKQQCDAETWDHFMGILARQYEDPKGFDEMIKDIEELFEDHPELIPGVRTLLADDKRDKVGAESKSPKNS